MDAKTDLLATRLDRSVDGLLTATAEHPQLDYVRRRIESLLALVQIEEDGVPVEPDGLRLRNLGHWAFASCPDAFSALGSPSGYCDLDCDFCYEHGNPLPMERTQLSIVEAETRLRHYRQVEQRALPQFRTRLYEEPLLNRDLLEILRRMRRRFPEVEPHLTTNGRGLDARVVAALAELKPLTLAVSVNSASADLRRSLMHDERPERALGSLALLREHGLRFIASIVAWPSLPLEDLQRTVRFLDQAGAGIVRVTLPGYSRYFPGAPAGDWRGQWSSVVEALGPIRDEIATPVLISPGLFHITPLVPDIAGVAARSPAAAAGIRPGDLLTAIDGEPIHTRADANRLLAQDNRPGETRRVACTRGGSSFEAALTIPTEGSAELYPYWPEGYGMPTRHALGIMVYGDLDPSWVARTINLIRSHRAARPLILCSELLFAPVRTLLEGLDSLGDLLGDVSIAIRVPEQRFWGGNIISGDLWTCQDLVEAVRDFAREQGSLPDLVLIPSTFARESWVDLLGVPWSAVEQATGCLVALIPVQQITM